MNQPPASPDLIAPGNGTPALLIVGAVEEGCGTAGIFDRLPWPAIRLATCLEFAACLPCCVPCMVVCERDLADFTWKDVLALTAQAPVPPPLIVTSRLADERLWGEVLNLGGFDVLAKPLDLKEVGRVLASAWSHWMSRAFPSRLERPARLKATAA